MEKIIFGTGLKTGGVFWDSKYIKEIHCRSTIPPSIIGFNNEVYNNATLYVPKGCNEAYHTAIMWREFKTIVEEWIDNLLYYQKAYYMGIISLIISIISISISVIVTGIPFYCKYTKTRSHTDNFGENNVKCLIAKGICRFVPHSSAGGF